MCYLSFEWNRCYLMGVLRETNFTVLEEWVYNLRTGVKCNRQVQSPYLILALYVKWSKILEEVWESTHPKISQDI